MTLIHFEIGVVIFGIIFFIVIVTQSNEYKLRAEVVKSLTVWKRLTRKKAEVVFSGVHYNVVRVMPGSTHWDEIKMHIRKDCDNVADMVQRQGLKPSEAIEQYYKPKLNDKVQN